MLKNWLYLSKLLNKKYHGYVLAMVFFFPSLTFSQIANYVTNGGFEQKVNCNYPAVLNKAIGWNCVGSDTTKFGGALYAINCYSNAPLSGAGFQYPHSGDTYGRITMFCSSPCTYTNSRIYPKNRLKSKLIANTTYCVKMYVSLENAAPHAISNLGFYFSDNSIDTINYCYTPLTYINPQVNNPVINIITDTLNWVLVTGSFIATGNEKYLVIGNFETDAATTKSAIVTSTNEIWSEYFIDDISCIDINLPAYAGPD